MPTDKELELAELVQILVNAAKLAHDAMGQPGEQDTPEKQAAYTALGEALIDVDWQGFAPIS